MSSIRPGFAMIELLVVIALVVILVTLYTGALVPGSPGRRFEACRQNLQRIHVALQVYANDAGGKFPARPGARTAEEVLYLLVPRYSADTAIFICPSSRDAPLPSGESFRDRRISYAYYMGERPANERDVLLSDRQIDTRPRHAGEYAFSLTGNPPGNNHQKHGGNFLYCDGSVEASPARVPFAVTPAVGVELLNPKP
jgi:prepilin-type N-terminal cleavage/methylation domain-containing protein/prepilin-type processing-associated H-X9-DG protein